MQAALSWTPAGGAGSLSQNVQYKKYSDAGWTTFSNVGPTVSTATVTGLDPNTVYQFRIQNVCSAGGPTNGGLDEKILLTCPTVTLSNITDTSLDYSFPGLGGSVDTYDVQLLDASNTVLSTQVKADATTVTGTFPSLTSGTVYKVKVVPHATGTVVYSKTDCAPVSTTTATTTTTTTVPTTTTTTTASPCLAPSTVTATLS